MILTLLRINFINLRRDRVVQALTFALPIIFFSIFALVFGNQHSATSRVKVAVVDEDQSEYSRRLVQELIAEGSLHVRTTRSGDEGPTLDRSGAEAAVREGIVPVAIVLPRGIGAGTRLWGLHDATTPPVDVLADVSDPVAPQMVRGILQKVSFTAAQKPSSPTQEGATGTQPAMPFGLPVKVTNVLQAGRNDTSMV